MKLYLMVDITGLKIDGTWFGANRGVKSRERERERSPRKM